jgi:hypothetical protein
MQGFAELPLIASNDKLFLQYKKTPSPGHLDVRQLSRYIAFTNDALAVLHHLRHEWTGRDEQCIVHESAYDEVIAANLEHLLLRMQHSLLKVFVDRLAKLLLANVSSKQKGKLGGEQWCSEFSNNKHPLSTTWPWSIKPSLAVLWGVCWMFYGEYGQNEENLPQHRGSTSSQGGQNAPQDSQAVPQDNFLNDPENTRLFNEQFRPQVGACKYTQSHRLRISSAHSLTAGEDLAYGQQALDGIIGDPFNALGATEDLSTFLTADDGGCGGVGLAGSATEVATTAAATYSSLTRSNAHAGNRTTTTPIRYNAPQSESNLLSIPQQFEISCMW